MKETVNIVSKIVGIDGNLESSPHRLSGDKNKSYVSWCYGG